MHRFEDKEAAAGPALGLFANANYDTTTTQLAPGDGVLLFTDGIIEAENATGSEWGAAGLTRTVGANLQAQGAELLCLILESAQTFTGAAEFADDICVATVELPALAARAVDETICVSKWSTEVA